MYISNRKVRGIDCEGWFFASELQITKVCSSGNSKHREKDRVLFVTLGDIQRDLDVQCPVYGIDAGS